MSTLSVVNDSSHSYLKIQRLFDKRTQGSLKFDFLKRVKNISRNYVQEKGCAYL